MAEPGNTPAGAALKKTGIILILVCLCVGGFIYVAFGGDDDNDPRAMLAIPFFMASVGGMLVYFRGRQRAAKALVEGAGSPVRTSKAGVLYLRAFQTDPSTFSRIVASSLSTEEEQLAAVLRPFGDLIAVGRPGEKLPLPGAVRMYASDSEWRELVLDHMRSARLTVIRAGGGPGLLWEIGQAFSMLPLERILILVLKLPLNEYRGFAAQVKNNTRVSLPTIERASLVGRLSGYNEGPSHAAPGFVRFSGDGTPAFLPLPFTLGQTGFNDLKKPFNLALRPVFEQHAVGWRSVGRFH